MLFILQLDKHTSTLNLDLLQINAHCLINKGSQLFTKSVIKQSTVSLFMVIVPVLSRQRRLRLPKDSKDLDPLIIVCLLAILWTLIANVQLIIIGKPSGMAATAKLTPKVRVSKRFRPCNRHITEIKEITAIEIRES
eukprot:NODE_611_length_6023_cov_0.126435.p3 type:complete len:137 gc:universal NODE_611_length_6023_cov_0.126435:1246-836(-)